MMAEYIEREVLLAAYDAAHEGEPGGARKLIADAPAEDVAPVVRCRDCVHWLNEDGLDDHVCLKIYNDGAVSCYAWQLREPDDFCSYGERKDGG